MDQILLLNDLGAGRVSPRSAEKECRMHRWGCDHGFTILEVIVAIMIFIISLMGLISVTTSVIQGNAFSQQVTTATNLAQEELEVLKRKGYDHADLTAGTHNDPGNPVSSIYTRSWTVLANTPDTDIKTLTMTVSWNWRGAARNVQLVTYITKK